MSAAERWKSRHPESAEELQAALEMKHKALEINRVLGSLTGMVDDYSRLAVLYCLAGDMDTARVMLDSAMAVDRERSRSDRIADCCSELGRILLSGSAPDQAEPLLLESLRLHRALGQHEAAISDYLGLLSLCRLRGDEERAIVLLLEALEIERRRKAGEFLAVLLGWLAAVYLRRGRSASALPLLDEACEIYRKRRNDNGLAEALGHLGLALTTLGRLEAAEEALSEASHLNRALQRKDREADNLANLGNLYWSAELPREAKGYYEAALALFRELGDRRKAGQVERLLHDLAIVGGRAEG